MFNIKDFVLKNLEEELSYFKDGRFKTFAVKCIEYSPPLYWKKPAAFYNGHHPYDELGAWGNLRHVKRVFIIGRELAEAEGLSSDDHDILLVALLIHDIGKYGREGTEEKIMSDHPLLVRAMIPTDILDYTTGNKILKIVESHMGRWGKIPPYTKLEKLAHYADYLASRLSIYVYVKLKLIEKVGKG